MSKNESSNRIEYLDIAKGIGIILVIMGHSGFLFDNLKTYFFSFHMPLFFVISGMLLCVKKEDELDLHSVWSKKLRTMMIPYLWFSGIYMIIYIVNIILGYMTMADLWQSLVYTLDWFGDSTLWFLPTLLLSEAGFLFLCKKIHGPWSLIVSIVIGVICYGLQALITPVWARYNDSFLVTNLVDFVRGFLRAGIATSFVAVGFFAVRTLGVLLVENTETVSATSDIKGDGILAKIPARRRIADLVIGVILLILTYGASYFNETADFHRIVLGNYFLFFLSAVLGSFGIIFVSKAIGRMFILAFYGRSSLIIMCTHLNFYVLFGAIKWAWLVNNIVTRAKSYVFMFNIVVAALVLETVIILLINRFFPFVLGKKRG